MLKVTMKLNYDEQTKRTTDFTVEYRLFGILLCKKIAHFPSEDVHGYFKFTDRWIR